MKLVNMTKRAAGEYTAKLRGLDVEVVRAPIGFVPRIGRRLRSQAWVVAVVGGETLSDPCATMGEAVAQADAVLAARAS